MLILRFLSFIFAFMVLASLASEVDANTVRDSFVSTAGPANGPSQYVNSGTFAQWQAHSGGESHSLTGAPQLTTDGHLLAGSPAIDAGDNTVIPVNVTTDLDGNPRRVDIPSVPDTGSGTPPIVDMGAFEAEETIIYLPLIRR